MESVRLANVEAEADSDSDVDVDVLQKMLH